MNTDSDLDRAKKLLFRALALRPMTEHQLCARLVAKGFEERTVEAAINDLRRLKLIDDAAFARAWVEERMRLRPVGREMLDAELSLKGVAEEIRDIVINETFSEIDPLMVAIDALRKKMAVYKQRDRPTVLRRMTGFLRRRGFDEETSLSAAETVWKDIHERMGVFCIVIFAIFIFQL